MIILINVLYIIFFIIYFKTKQIEYLIQKIVFNLIPFIVTVIGVILVLLLGEITIIKNIINIIFLIFIIYELISSFIVIGFVKLIHLVSKQTREKDKNYKLSINMFPIVSYGYILLLNNII